MPLVAVLAVMVSTVAVYWVAANGYTLYYGDAEAHLNIARRIWDNREPRYREIGTVWLPLPHLAMLPLTLSDLLWQTGLAGAIPSALAFVAACVLFFASLHKVFGGVWWAAAAGTAAVALNPNLLYLQAAPMTESLFLAALAGILCATVYGRPGWAGVATCAATLIRYEGWFLIPAVVLYVLVRSGLLPAIRYGAIASLGPVYWLIHNWLLFGSALYFYNGPWSAKAIYQRQLDSGMKPHPADGNWLEAARYFGEASRLAMGEGLLIAGLAGCAYLLIKRRALWPVMLLALPPLFYVWSLHSSGTPIFIPTLWPFSYYNSRYALAILPLLGLGVAALCVERRMAALALAVVCLAPWFTTRLGKEQWVCWKESQVNSENRREWTAKGAKFLRDRYHRTEGIWLNFGDLTAILREARIPLKEALHEGNELQFNRTVARPDLFLRERWVVTFAESPVAQGLAKLPYDRVATYPVQYGKPVEIYKRRPD
ncbi:hypothetical protein F183_A04070 [Bryobacterales bacterium F-183]|nr:hypothetical protein F183_A04070 [Bryobacterales bacterium F-183]